MNIEEIVKKYCNSNKNQVFNAFMGFLRDNNNPFSRKNSMGHITASCWILNRELSKVLLTHHKKLGIWIPPGGHSEGEEDPMEIALREGLEETGLALSPLDLEPFSLDIHWIPSHKNVKEHKHYDFTYIFTPKDTMEYTVSEESIDLKWFSLSDIMKITREENILLMVEKTKKGKFTNGK